MKISKIHRLILTTILSVCVIVPLTNDIFISGIPAMKQVFVGNNISLVLSFSLLGLALGQLFYGPLSDRFGRKPILLTGLVVYILASAQVMTANSFAALLAGRLFQAIGACSATISALAIARDTCEHHELVGATSLIMAIMGVGPALAPLIGSFLNHTWGWRASFEFLFILGCCYFIWVAIFFKETHINKNKDALLFKNIWKNYLHLWQQPQFLRNCLTSGFSYGVLFSYIGLAPFFIIEQLHFSVLSFGIIVAINAIAIIITAAFIPTFVTRYSLQAMTRTGLATIFSGGVMMWLLNIFYAMNIYTLMIPIFFTTIGIGMIRPTASAGAMQHVQRNLAGSAASLFNLISFVSGTIAITFATKFIQNEVNFGLYIGALGGLALLMQFVYVNQN